MKKIQSKSRPDGGDAANVLDLPACTNTSLRRAARRMGNLYDDALEPVGLRATQVSLLAEIQRIAAANEGRAPTLQDLAAQLAIQISAITHALRPLVRDGLIVLHADDQDKRTKRASLTTVGVERLGEAIAHWSAANQRVEQVLGQEAAAALRAIADYVASEEFFSAYRLDDKA
ncbi:MarR family winged helix-turn-helix transcriptional regulator [Duganella aceris]|uniref:Winged helix-turn-helix transcriptional regulator n=1 Tax=Duganella aceris TaxID=2703883 RepID=A0ABX0FR79_9BURK|nr:MarR family winged helix-turn-helix transcriptional regulator [Duganella aceris]NGZ86925.1 winged helix-turn-helix transcriptional regulator [Duganella aceris]